MVGSAALHCLKKNQTIVNLKINSLWNHVSERGTESAQSGGKAYLFGRKDRSSKRKWPLNMAKKTEKSGGMEATQKYIRVNLLRRTVLPPVYLK